MRTLAIMVFAALLLAGCTSSQPGRGEMFASKAEIDAKDDAACRGYGAKPGEPAYIQCRVAQDQRRDAYLKD